MTERVIGRAKASALAFAAWGAWAAMGNIAYPEAQVIRDAEGNVKTIQLPDVAPEKAQEVVDWALGHRGGRRPGGPKPLVLQDMSGMDQRDLPVTRDTFVLVAARDRAGNFHPLGAIFGQGGINNLPLTLIYIDFEEVHPPGLPVFLVVSDSGAGNVAGKSCALVHDRGTTFVYFPPALPSHVLYLDEQGGLYLDAELTQKVN